MKLRQIKIVLEVGLVDCLVFGSI